MQPKEDRDMLRNFVRELHESQVQAQEKTDKDGKTSELPEQYLAAGDKNSVTNEDLTHQQRSLTSVAANATSNNSVS